MKHWPSSYSAIFCWKPSLMSMWRLFYTNHLCKYPDHHDSSILRWHWSPSGTMCAVTPQNLLRNTRRNGTKSWRHPTGPVGWLNWVFTSETMFGWVLWGTEHPHKCQDQGSPLEHCIVCIYELCSCRCWSVYVLVFMVILKQKCLLKAWLGAF